MAASKDQVRDLLGQGLSNDVVATAVGLTPGAISAMMADEEFRDSVILLRTSNLTAHSARDRSIGALEDKILQKAHEVIDHIYKPKEVIAVLKAVNGLVRRGVASQQAAVTNNVIVQLNIPQTVIKQYTVNAHKEVVDVEGQTLVTVSADGLLKKLAAEKGASDNEHDRQKAEQYRQAAKYLPTESGGVKDAIAAELKLKSLATSGEAEKGRIVRNGHIV